MKNEYEILGISKDATDQQIRDAYSKLEKKYDPGSYEKESLKSYAEKKTKEITAAFDKIMNDRRVKRMEEASDKSEQGTVYVNRGQQGGQTFECVADLIKQSRLDEAEDLLDGMDQGMRVAQWYYLKGMVFLKKGWLGEAINFFSAALKMEPDNINYKKEYTKALLQSKGDFGFPNSGKQVNDQYPPMCGGASNICIGLMCADVCCRCMGRNPNHC